jgi:hypothetical protein
VSTHNSLELAREAVKLDSPLILILMALSLHMVRVSLFLAMSWSMSDEARIAQNHAIGDIALFPKRKKSQV